MTRIFKLLTIASLLISINCYSQSESYFIGKKPLVTYKNGYMGKEKIAKISAKEFLSVKFDGKLVNVTGYTGNTGYTLENYQEEEGLERIEVIAYDFDKDGKKEIVVARGFKGLVLSVTVFSSIESGAIKIGEFDGQSQCGFDGNKLILPFGSQGLYSEYSYVKGVFTQTN